MTNGKFCLTVTLYIETRNGKFFTISIGKVVYLCGADVFQAGSSVGMSMAVHFLSQAICGRTKLQI